jgi:hypothetical protein
MARARDVYVLLIAGVVLLGLVTVTCPHPTLPQSKQDNNKKLKRATTEEMIGALALAQNPFWFVFIIHFVF